MFWDLSLTEEHENFSQSISENENCFTMDSSFTEREFFASPAKADMSIYESEPETMPYVKSPEPSPFNCRRPLMDLDNNSQDSGYSACESLSSKRLSFSSIGSIDDASLDFSELEQNSETPKLPGDFGMLISGCLARRDSPKVAQRGLFRRAYSMVDNATTTPNSSRARCLFKEENRTGFKRPEPPSENASPNVKRSRGNPRTIKHVAAKSLYRSASVNEDSIKSALQRSSTEPDLVGDFSKPFCLPLTHGKHRDLKSITPATLAQLIRGEFAESVASYQVIDCRYPYEFNGGHIAGAKNLYTKQQIVEHLVNAKCNAQPTESENHKRNILVFHCEFSSERGPNLSRYLRNVDRSHNKDFYPFLHYPEVYLLDGGYKHFYETHASLCTPEGYLPMLHPDHEHSLRIHRAESKTFNVDAKQKSGRSSSFKRL